MTATCCKISHERIRLGPLLLKAVTLLIGSCIILLKLTTDRHAVVLHDNTAPHFLSYCGAAVQLQNSLRHGQGVQAENA